MSLANQIKEYNKAFYNTLKARGNWREGRTTQQ